MQSVKIRRQSCGRCVDCSSRQKRARTWCGTGTLDEFDSWWPAGISSPTVYYHVRARQLQYQCLHSAIGGGTWRLVDEGSSALLSRRGQSQLRVRVPAAFTNVLETDTVELLGKLLVSFQPHASKGPFQGLVSQQQPQQQHQAGEYIAHLSAAAPAASQAITASSSTLSPLEGCYSSGSAGPLGKRTRLFNPLSPQDRQGHLLAPAVSAGCTQWQPTATVRPGQASCSHGSEQPHGRPPLPCSSQPPKAPCLLIPLKAKQQPAQGSSYAGVLVAQGGGACTYSPTGRHAKWLAQLKGLKGVVTELGWRSARSSPSTTPAAPLPAFSGWAVPVW